MVDARFLGPWEARQISFEQFQIAIPAGVAKLDRPLVEHALEALHIAEIRAQKDLPMLFAMLGNEDAGHLRLVSRFDHDRCYL